jgi:phospholipid/cholesterol/gamma-HCH transport system permease protein
MVRGTFRSRAAAGPDAGWVEPERAGGALTVRAGGDWRTARLASLAPLIDALDAGDAGLVRFDLGGIEHLDTAGAWLLHRAMRDMEARGLSVELGGASPDVRSLIDTVARSDTPAPAAPARAPSLTAMVERTGRATVEVLVQARDMVIFLGHTVVVLGRSLRRPRSIRVTALVAHMESSGLDALPIIGLLSFLIGVVLAYQGADQLAQFGAEIYTANLVGVGMLREMGILLTAIIVAGRSGSAYTAQIGTMTVNEEVDAMRTIGLDPMDVLVLPRVLALIMVLPLLTFYADMMGLIGGAVMASVALDITMVEFARQLHDAVSTSTLMVGLIKSPVFAFIIAMVGCHEGLRVTRSAESVGRMTTRAVVEAIFLVIVLDALFSILFSVIGY